METSYFKQRNRGIEKGHKREGWHCAATPDFLSARVKRKLKTIDNLIMRLESTVMAQD